MLCGEWKFKTGIPVIIICCSSIAFLTLFTVLLVAPLTEAFECRFIELLNLRNKCFIPIDGDQHATWNHKSVFTSWIEVVEFEGNVKVTKARRVKLCTVFPNLALIVAAGELITADACRNL